VQSFEELEFVENTDTTKIGVCSVFMVSIEDLEKIWKIGEKGYLSF